MTQYPPTIRAGLGRYVEEITPHLARAHELLVCTLNDGRQPVRERHGTVTVYRPCGRLLGVALRRRPPNSSHPVGFILLALQVLASNWRYVAWLRRQARAGAGRPDLVAVHDATNFLAAALCHYVLRLPVVLHVHTTEHGTTARRGLGPLLRLLAGVERWLGRIARRVVVATPEMREHLAAAGWDRASIAVIPLGGGYGRLLADPGFDRTRLRAEAADLRTRLGIAAEERVLLFVGRLVPHKGIFALLAAMPKIVAAVAGVRLVVAGDGDRAGVQRVVAEAGLDDRVLVSAALVSGRDLPAYYEMADLCVFPSVFEPFGLVATEAMALGKPTVLGSGFSRTFLGDPGRPAARFVRESDTDDLAQAVVALLVDPSAGAALGERGERLVRERLSWDRAADRTLAVYQEAHRMA